MLRNILIIGAAATCLAVPAAAESYVRGDGCGGTYIDRKSEMMAGNLSGGTRYKCTPFPRTSEAATTTRSVSPLSYQYAPSTTSKHSYTSPRQTYHSGTVTRSAPARSTYSAGSHYVTSRPSTTHTPATPYYSSGYPSGSRYVTTTPQTNYHSGSTYRSTGTTYHSSGTTTYSSGSHGYVTTRPTSSSHYGSHARTAHPTTTSQGTRTYMGQTHNTVTTQPHNPHGTARVTGNLANSFTTETEEHPEQPFSFGKPETFVRTNPK